MRALAPVTPEHSLDLSGVREPGLCSSQSKCPAHNFTSTFVTRPFLACRDLQGEVGVQTPKSPCWDQGCGAGLGTAAAAWGHSCLWLSESSGGEQGREPPRSVCSGIIKVMGTAGCNSALQGLRLSINGVNEAVP